MGAAGAAMNHNRQLGLPEAGVVLASVAPVVPAAGGSTRAGRSECESEPHAWL